MNEQIKKEAEELVGRFEVELAMYNADWVKGMREKAAKQCAVICCEEIIKSYDKANVDYDDIDFINHYTQLKQYIQTKM